MAKAKSIFVCSECGYENAKWLGRCPECQQWNTFIEEIISSQPQNAPAKNTPDVAPKLLRDISTAAGARIDTGSAELNRVLGGGIVPASMILLCGDPGIGKSTILLQAAEDISRNHKVLYISAEESREQIKMRADRLNASASSELYILSETGIDEILAGIEKVSPSVVIVDSIQTVYASDTFSAPGTVSQVRNCASMLMRMAKSRSIAVFLVGHVTKEGAIAGPKVLEH
ncbi:MAG TPA: AAA family ATPase, partial [Clostridia bacterium]|nr:AAA family ATPase [Clostridia bacterium]